jgi:hypothetical protein
MHTDSNTDRLTYSMNHVRPRKSFRPPPIATSFNHISVNVITCRAPVVGAIADIFPLQLFSAYRTELVADQLQLTEETSLEIEHTIVFAPHLIQCQNQFHRDFFILFLSQMLFCAL